MRTFKNGLLRSSATQGCAKVNPKVDDIMIGNLNNILTTGDPRGNENAGMLAVNCLFVLEHNRLAKLIKA